MQIYEVYPSMYHHILVYTSIYEDDHSYPWCRDSRCTTEGVISEFFRDSAILHNITKSRSVQIRVVMSQTVTVNQCQSGGCTYMINMRNMHLALFCILVLGFTYIIVHIDFAVALRMYVLI
jgi:hypothetical protein